MKAEEWVEKEENSGSAMGVKRDVAHGSHMSPVCKGMGEWETRVGRERMREKGNDERG